MATLLDQLEQWKARFEGPEPGELEALLRLVAAQDFDDARSLIRLHETLLFLRAYPRSAKVARMADDILFGFAGRVERLRAADADLVPLAEPEVSGIAGTLLSAVYTYEVARSLARRYPRDLEINWEQCDHPDRLGAGLAPFLPLLPEETPEAHVPYQRWLREAGARDEGELAWLIERLERLDATPAGHARLYDSLHLPVVWDLADGPATRTRLRLPVKQLYCHDRPLLKRSEVSLERELAGPPLPLSRVPRREAEKILDAIVDTSAMRYRELYGFSHPDARKVLRADAGRGVEMYLFGVPPDWRLPLRAYHAGAFFKNGVPIGYVEVLSLFDRAEIGFNLYYTFRDGESAWLYARMLRLFSQVLGVSCFSVDPYQIGHENHEAIEAGAFWFYRKLGFRPLDPAVARLVVREERRIRETPGYRTPAAVLKKLAAGYLLYEGAGARPGDWDRFRVRNIGLAVQSRMAERYGGDAEHLRRDAARLARSVLGLDSDSGLVQALMLVPDLRRWSARERSALAAIVRAKAAGEEARYLRLMQRHERLRVALLALGAEPPAAIASAQAAAGTR